MKNIRKNIVRYTVDKYVKTYACTADEVRIWYGDNVVALYNVELKDEDGALMGLEYADGTFGVCGCSLDVEGLTKAQMEDMLVKEFER